MQRTISITDYGYPKVFMAISMYQASVPQLKKMLVNLTAILTKAEEHVATKAMDDKVLAEARLFPDMFPLASRYKLLVIK